MSNRQGEPYESFRVDVEQSHRVSEVCRERRTAAWKFTARC
jgi:hypothetical protein